jgi:hypothetical protein
MTVPTTLATPLPLFIDRVESRPLIGGDPGKFDDRQEEAQAKLPKPKMKRRKRLPPGVSVPLPNLFVVFGE